MFNRFFSLWNLLAVTLIGVMGSALGAQQPSQGTFVPANTLPPATDQIPAASLLIPAYAFAWIAVLFYVWTIWRRLNKVESDMHALERRSHAR